VYVFVCFVSRAAYPQCIMHVCVCVRGHVRGRVTGQVISQRVDATTLEGGKWKGA
jgi:hypothetical protein